MHFRDTNSEQSRNWCCFSLKTAHWSISTTFAFRLLVLDIFSQSYSLYIYSVLDGIFRNAFQKTDVWTAVDGKCWSDNNNTKAEINIYLYNFDIQLTVSDKSRDCTWCWCSISSVDIYWAKQYAMRVTLVHSSLQSCWHIADSVFSTTFEPLHLSVVLHWLMPLTLLRLYMHRCMKSASVGNWCLKTYIQSITAKYDIITMHRAWYTENVKLWQRKSHVTTSVFNKKLRYAKKAVRQLFIVTPLNGCSIS